MVERVSRQRLRRTGKLNAQRPEQEKQHNQQIVDMIKTASPA
jgi:hypothetical protein